MTIFFNSKEPNEKGVIVHSKAKGHGYTQGNWAGFEKRVEQAFIDNKVQL